MNETGTDVTDQQIIEAMQREIEDLEAQLEISERKTMVSELEYDLSMAKHATATKHTKLVKAKAQLTAAEATIERVRAAFHIDDWQDCVNAIKAALKEDE